ncbi:MAG: hypothetical protein GX337_05005 [Christensenellaceae bacterium]|nr:hypothetical protein [Christensenellaceae bacterium]
MKLLVLCTASIFIITALILRAYCKVKHRRDRKLMEYVRASNLYLQLYEIMNNIGNFAVDEIIIENSGVRATSVYPAHKLFDYSFKQNGNSCRNKELARIVALLLAMDFSLLSDPSIYQLRRYRIYRMNGKKEYGFRYTLRRHYKDEIFSYRQQMHKSASLLIR